MAPLALIAVTAVWGVTFVQVKDAVKLYPLLGFLAVRFVLATATLAVPGAARVPSLGRRGAGAAAMLGLLLALGYVLQTTGLERTTVSGTGFITGMYVVLTPLLALLLFRTRIGLAAWLGVALSTVGVALLSGIHAGSATGDLFVLAASAVYSLQIVLMEQVWTALFGYTLAGDRLGAIGWEGCAAIMAGILLAEPAAAGALVSAVSSRSRR